MQSINRVLLLSLIIVLGFQNQLTAQKDQESAQLKKGRPKQAKSDSASAYRVIDGVIKKGDSSLEPPVSIRLSVGSSVRMATVVKLMNFLKGIEVGDTKLLLMREPENDQKIFLTLTTKHPRSVYKNIFEECRKLGVTKSVLIPVERNLPVKKEGSKFELKNGMIVSGNSSLKVPTAVVLSVGMESLHMTKVRLWDRCVKMGIKEIQVEVKPEEDSKVVEVIFYSDVNKSAFVDIEKVLKKEGATKVTVWPDSPVWLNGTKVNLKKAMQSGPVICFFRADNCLVCKKFEEASEGDYSFLSWLRENKITLVRFDMTESGSEKKHGIPRAGVVGTTGTVIFSLQGRKVSKARCASPAEMMKKADLYFGDRKGWIKGI